MSEKIVWLKRYYIVSLNMYIHVPTVYFAVISDFASVMLIMHITFTVIHFFK